MLLIQPEELQQLAAQLDNYHNTLDGAKASVHFAAAPAMSVVDFLSCFECQMHRDVEGAEGGHPSASVQVHVHQGLSEGRQARLGEI